MVNEHLTDTKFANPRDILAGHALLSEGFKYVLAHNSSAMAPYHNTRHLMCVVKYVDYLLRAERKLGACECEDELDELSLLLAALFHDVDHSMGKLDDEANVQNAKAAFACFLDVTDTGDIREEWLWQRVCRLIDATQYPYAIPSAQLTYEQGVIRDADLMQAYDDDMFHHLTMGLSIELGTPLMKTLEGNIVFHSAVTPCTESGRAYRELALPALLREFSEYIKLLE